MTVYEKNIEKLLSNGESTDAYIRLSSAIITSSNIEPETKLDILKNMVHKYANLKGNTKITRGM